MIQNTLSRNKTFQPESCYLNLASRFISISKSNRPEQPYFLVDDCAEPVLLKLHFSRFPDRSGALALKSNLETISRQSRKHSFWTYINRAMVWLHPRNLNSKVQTASCLRDWIRVRWKTPFCLKLLTLLEEEVSPFDFTS